MLVFAVITCAVLVSIIVRASADEKRRSVEESMSNLMEDLVRVKKEKGIDFLREAAKVMPDSYVYGYYCVMSYDVLWDWKEDQTYPFDPRVHPDCIRITIRAYPDIISARRQSGWFAQTNYIVAELASTGKGK